MTKVEAIKKVMQANGGQATLQQIYQEVNTYKPDIQNATDWKAGIRGVLYREVRNQRSFRKVHDAAYELIE